MGRRRIDVWTWLFKEECLLLLLLLSLCPLLFSQDTSFPWLSIPFVEREVTQNHLSSWSFKISLNNKGLKLFVKKNKRALFYRKSCSDVWSGIESGVQSSSCVSFVSHENKGAVYSLKERTEGKKKWKSEAQKKKLERERNTQTIKAASLSFSVLCCKTEETDGWGRGWHKIQPKDRTHKDILSETISFIWSTPCYSLFEGKDNRHLQVK